MTVIGEYDPSQGVGRQAILGAAEHAIEVHGDRAVDVLLDRASKIERQIALPAVTRVRMSDLWAAAVECERLLAGRGAA